MFGLDHLREQFLHKEMELCKYGLGSNIYLCIKQIQPRLRLLWHKKIHGQQHIYTGIF